MINPSSSKPRGPHEEPPGVSSKILSTYSQFKNFRFRVIYIFLCLWPAFLMWGCYKVGLWFFASSEERRLYPMLEEDAAIGAITAPLIFLLWLFYRFIMKRKNARNTEKA